MLNKSHGKHGNNAELIHQSNRIDWWFSYGHLKKMIKVKPKSNQSSFWYGYYNNRTDTSAIFIEIHMICQNRLHYSIQRKMEVWEKEYRPKGYSQGLQTWRCLHFWLLLVEHFFSWRIDFKATKLVRFTFWYAKENGGVRKGIWGIQSRVTDMKVFASLFAWTFLFLANLFVIKETILIYLSLRKGK